MDRALEKALKILRNPDVGKDLPTVTEEQREQLQALAQQVDFLLDQMCDVMGPDFDLGDIIHELGAMGRDLHNIITNKVALETEDERKDRQRDGALTAAEYEYLRSEDPDCFELQQYRAYYA
jgi:hypothetical protein